MTQSSLIQAEHRTNFPNSDSGPYSADDWARMHTALFTPNTKTVAGVAPRYLNELEPQVSGSNITVDTGGGMVNGRYFNNDALVTFAPLATGANSRIDIVVMCVNNTEVNFSSSIAQATPLGFPTVLTDYVNASLIQPYVCRLVTVKGAESGSPVAPILDQDPLTLYMIPICQYEIDSGGTITNFLDRRQYIGGTGGGSTLIADILLGSNGDFDIQNIPPFFTDLRIEALIKSAYAPATPPSFEIGLLYFNAAAFAGTEYDHDLQLVNNGTAWSFLPQTSAPYISVQWLESNDNPDADQFSPLMVDIKGYSDTSKNTTIYYRTSAFSPGQLWSSFSNGWWDNPAAINRIRFETGTASTWLAGSRLRLFGI